MLRNAVDPWMVIMDYNLLVDITEDLLTRLKEKVELKNLRS